jgi:hypothetical protein
LSSPDSRPRPIIVFPVGEGICQLIANNSQLQVRYASGGDQAAWIRIATRRQRDPLAAA